MSSMTLPFAFRQQRPYGADLGHYIRDVYLAPRYDVILSDSIFEYGITHFPPRLMNGRVNRIIVYPGCFNPPHVGHLATLRHGFSSAGLDLNIIAAIILPFDDDRVERKYRSSTSSHRVLPKKHRSLLWRKDVDFPSDWAWTFPGSEVTFSQFQANLIKKVQSDGFALEFVCLAGSDNVFPGYPPPKQYECDSFLVSDSGRAATSTYYEAPIRFLGWDNFTWTQPTFHRHLAEQRSEYNAQLIIVRLKHMLVRDLGSEKETEAEMIRSISKELVAEAEQPYCSMHHCQRNTETTAFIRFIHDLAPRLEHTRNHQRPISSSIIRSALIDGDQHILNLALSSNLLGDLWRMIL